MYKFIFMFFLAATTAMADPVSNRQWTYLSDQVMGGVSQGRAQLIDDEILLQGTVSTANNGGFIQVRTPVNGMSGQGLRLRARGNGEVYYIHIRTPATVVPWHYYSASFTSGPEWADVNIPWAEFKPVTWMLPRSLSPDQIKSVGIVAYGRDHNAQLWVS
ncbi:MAG: CIA30 family protein, partial [Pseudomonadota bacterium]